MLIVLVVVCFAAGAAVLGRATVVAQSSPGNEPTSGTPFTSYRAALLMVRYHPELATSGALIGPTVRQILAEQTAWQIIDQHTTPGRVKQLKLNPAKPAFVYEWQTELANDAARARGELLNVFLRPDADWSLVTRDTAWNPKYTAIVDTFLFSRAKVDGREPRFAAQELVAVYKQHLELAASKVSTAFWISMPLPNYTYDFPSKSIRFTPAGAQERDGIELLDSAERPGAYWQIPASARATANYSLLGPIAQMKNTATPSVKPGMAYGQSMTDTWRDYFAIGSSTPDGEYLPYIEVLSLDRRLSVASVPLDPAIAERLAKASSYATMGRMSGLTARVHFEADRVELADRKIDRQLTKYGLLFARVRRVDIHGPEQEMLFSIDTQRLPPPAPGRNTERASSRTEAAAAKTAPTAAPPTLPVSSCGDLKPSGQTGGQLNVEFANLSNEPRKLYYVMATGYKAIVGTYPPKTRWPIQAFPSQSFYVTNEKGVCLTAFVIKPDTKVIETR